MSTISSNLASNWASSIFSKLDTSNQGYIDKSTLQSAFDSISSSTSSSSSSSSSVDSLFSSIDGNSDGKVTKSELTSSLEQLASQLNNAFDQMRMSGGQGGPGGMAGGPHPGPPPSDGQNGKSSDTGFTKDELTQQLSDMGSTDSKRSSLISSIVSNFDKADANGDGKVNREEAMAFGKSQQNASSSGSTGSTSATSSSSSSKSSEAAYMMQMMMLTQAYGGSSTTGLLNSSLSVSA